MKLFKRGATPGLRLFFATDLHASDTCFRKFLAAARVYEVDALILGGDVTGKSVVPLVPEARGYRLGQASHLDEEEFAEYKQRVVGGGGYVAIVEDDEATRLAEDADSLNEALIRLASERARAWRALAEERLEASKVRCYVSGGNDDPPEVLEAFRSDSNDSPVVFCDGEVVRIADQVEMLSVGHSNPTPWRTPREVSEEELGRRIGELAERLEQPERAIFNLHVPPHGTVLDSCPELDTSTFPPTPVRIGGELVFGHAGSSAVRDAIERHQPRLGLHGHIHESRGAVRLGRTLALNPGSESQDELLRGVIVTLGPNKVVHQFISG
jgi:Icc-related predicted phosphoesterase